MEPENKTLTFTQLLAETGLTQGEAIAALHKLGRDVFEEGLNKATFDEVEVSILIENLPARPRQIEKTKRPRQRKQIKSTRTKLRAKDPADSVRSLSEIADYFGTGVDIVQQACGELNIKPPNVDFRLGAKKAEQLRNHLAVTTYTVSEEHRTASDHLGETPLLVESSKRKQTSAGSAPRHMLLDKLADEVGTSIDDVKHVMVVLRIPIPAGSRPKVTTSQARRISDAVVMHKSLPTDRMDRGEVRIRPLLDRHEVSIKAGQEFCRQRGIVLTHGKYCSVDDGLRLLLHLADPSTLDHLRRWTEPQDSAEVPLNAAKEPVVAVNYEGNSLSRQDFSGYMFAGANLRGADLSFSNLSGADFSGADLSGANLTRATCAKANFTSANCTEVTFENAILNLADFTEADLTRATLVGCKVHRTNFTMSNLTGTDLIVPRDEYVILGQTTWIDGRKVNEISEIETR